MINSEKIDKSLIKILIVDDDKDLCNTCKKLFLKAGYNAECTTDPMEALRMAATDPSFNVILADLKMPIMDGVELLKAVKRIDDNIYFVIMTGYGTIENAVLAIKAGCFDYITKPFDKDEMLAVIDRIAMIVTMERQLRLLQSDVPEEYGFDKIVGRTPRMVKVIELAKLAAKYDHPYLISGASGTGRKHVARVVHYNSSRKKGPFVVMVTRSIPESMMEVELFGFKQERFDGKLEEKQGMIDAAKGGTLLIHEANFMSDRAALKLAEVLRDRKYIPLGNKGREMPLETRIAFTTLEETDEKKTGKIPDELYYQINKIEIKIPPISDRLEDIPFLVQHFIQKFNKKYDRLIRGVTPAFMNRLFAQKWDGNVRQLESIIESAFTLNISDEIDVTDLPDYMKERMEGEKSRFPAFQTVRNLKEVEKEMILAALEKFDYNKSTVAKALGISRTKLYKKLKEYGLEKGEK